MRERIIHGTPTLRALPPSTRRRVEGGICRRLGHRPHLCERGYVGATGAAQVIGEARVPGSEVRLPLLGGPAEERTGREVVCRRCWATCGDSLLEGV
jgi:hypothetical protein